MTFPDVKMMSDCVAMNCQCYFWLKMKRRAPEVRAWLRVGLPVVVSLPFLFFFFVPYPTSVISLVGVGITIYI